MNLGDRNKIIIGAVAIVVVAVVAAVFLSKRGRRAAPTDTGAATTVAEGEAADVGAAPAPGAVGDRAPGETTADTGAQVPPQVAAAPVHGLVRMGIGSAELSRPDPLLTFEPPPQPTPVELTVSLPPTTLYPGGIRPEGPAEAGVAGRRVAGVVFNDQAWGILEDQQGSFIVKPGDVVDGVRIAAIARDSILVVERDGTRLLVPLRGRGPSARTTASTVSGMPAMPPAAP
jgi:hypothetical protein